MPRKIDWIEPDWPAPERVKALVTTRSGGVSPAPWDSLNLGINTADVDSHVASNRQILVEQLGSEMRIQWIRQVHGSRVIEAGVDELPTADACFSRNANMACAVLTADCLPVLFCNASATQVAVAHAGWRGLAQGVLASTLQTFADPSEQIYAWLGPAISGENYQVGADLIESFRQSPHFSVDDEDQVFQQYRKGKWYADLAQIARIQLAEHGVTHVLGGDYCTYRDQQRFYSYRRDGETGRFASLIWLAK